MSFLYTQIILGFWIQQEQPKWLQWYVQSNIDVFVCLIPLAHTGILAIEEHLIL